MKKSQRRVVGAILKVPLGDGTHVYTQTLPEADFAFFFICTSSKLDTKTVISKPVLFRVAVHKSAWTGGRWERIGKEDVSEELMKPVPTFIQDALNPNHYQIYLSGNIRDATKEECIGLECCAVWDPDHVEGRIRAHYSGVDSKWVESMKIK